MADNSDYRTYQFEIKNPQGIGTILSRRLVEMTVGYRGQVFFSKGDREVEGNSLFGVMSLRVKPGDTLCIRVKGQDSGFFAQTIYEVIHP